MRLKHAYLANEPMFIHDSDQEIPLAFERFSMLITPNTPNCNFHVMRCHNTMFVELDRSLHSLCLIRPAEVVYFK